MEHPFYGQVMSVSIKIYSKQCERETLIVTGHGLGNTLQAESSSRKPQFL